MSALPAEADISAPGRQWG